MTDLHKLFNIAKDEEPPAHCVEKVEEITKFTLIATEDLSIVQTIEVVSSAWASTMLTLLTAASRQLDRRDFGILTKLIFASILEAQDALDTRAELLYNEMKKPKD